MTGARGSAWTRWFVAGCTALAPCAATGTLAAQAPCTVAAAPHAWPAPLDRPVSLSARGIPLREAIDRVGASAGVALAYASDLLPLERAVCVVADARPLGQVLDALLAGSRATPSVVAGRVVLVPRAQASAAPEEARRAVGLLDRVIVTGNTIAAARRPLAIGVQVIDGEMLRRHSVSSMAEALDGGAAGAWMWPSPSGGVLASYAGIRGASSFASSAPKVYLDGVEVATPLLLTQLDPDAVDRVEVIRGPQGAALYGSDAIGGVVNVVTRHDGLTPAGARLTLSSMAGASSSAFGASLVPTHDQRIALRLGDDLHSAGMYAQFGQSGAVFPSADARQVLLAADARAVDRAAIWTATARLFDRRVGAGKNPLLTNAPAAGATGEAAAATADPAVQVAREYTLGGTVTLATEGAWTHSLLLGLDGYRLEHVTAGDALYPVPVDSALRATQGAGNRATLRGSSVGHFGGEGAVPSTVVTIGFDQSLLSLASPLSTTTTSLAGVGYTTTKDATVRRSNYNAGLFSQVAASWNDAVFVSAGLRVENNDAFTGAHQSPLLPLLGVATVHEVGPATLKLRAAYGRGIRPPPAPSRGGYVEQRAGYGAQGTLDPESQSGTELGVELYLGRVASLLLTRYDQLASGLIQNVLVGVDSQLRGGVPERRARYQLQNVGEIGNHGWELQGSLEGDVVSLSAALTVGDSRVRALAPSYEGDLRAGDLMLGVPTRTASVTMAWTLRGWASTLSARRAAGWTNYDRLALARDYAASASGEIVGPRLREYWMGYDGQTHLRATASRVVHPGMELVVVGENLLGGQLGEPDNVTIRPGRSVMAGLRASF